MARLSLHVGSAGATGISLRVDLLLTHNYIDVSIKNVYDSVFFNVFYCEQSHSVYSLGATEFSTITIWRSFNIAGSNNFFGAF